MYRREMFTFYPNHLGVRRWSYGDFMFHYSGTMVGSGAGSIPFTSASGGDPMAVSYSLVAELGVLEGEARGEAE